MTNEFDAGFVDLAERVRRYTVQVHAQGRGDGSGVLWSDDGAVVTNAHVVGDARDVRIDLHDGRSLRGVVTLRDERLDLAEVRTASPPSDLVAASTGRSAALRVGDVVAALGAPLGIAGALTIGIVHRAAAQPDGRPRRWIEADLRLAPGNSGGPLIDASGRVVGINSMIAGGLALAVPSEIAQRFVVSRGARAWLGVTTQPVAVNIAASASSSVQRAAIPWPRGANPLPRGANPWTRGANPWTRGANPWTRGAKLREQPEVALGLLIVELATGGPAERAGLLLGDVILGAASQRFTWPGGLSLALDGIGPGARITIEMLRAGTLRTIDVATGSSGGKAERAA